MLPVPHIYSSVGYWVSFVFFRVLPQPLIRQTESAPHFLFANRPKEPKAKKSKYGGLFDFTRIFSSRGSEILALLGKEFDSNDFILAFNNMFPQEYASALRLAGSYQALNRWIANEILKKVFSDRIQAVGEGERLSINRNKTVNKIWRKI